MAYICIILLLFGSAFFSGSEIAYTSLNKLKLKKESENPKGVMKVVLYIYNHYDRALSTILIGKIQLHGCLIAGHCIIHQNKIV